MNKEFILYLHHSLGNLRALSICTLLNYDAFASSTLSSEPQFAFQALPFFTSRDSSLSMHRAASQSRHRGRLHRCSQSIQRSHCNHKFCLYHFSTHWKMVPPGFCISQGPKLDGNSLSLGLREQLMHLLFGVNKITLFDFSLQLLQWLYFALCYLGMVKKILFQ